jgi:hypothetical protein
MFAMSISLHGQFRIHIIMEIFSDEMFGPILQGQRVSADYPQEKILSNLMECNPPFFYICHRVLRLSTCVLLGGMQVGVAKMVLSI